MTTELKDIDSKVLISDSTIETIDSAFYKFIDQTLNLSCTTEEGWRKTPVIWSFAERAYQIKNNKDVRDKYGTLIAPLISIQRLGISKDMTKKGLYQGNIPENNRHFVGVKLKQDRTSKFANADSLRANKQINFATSKKNKKQVYEYYSVEIPVYTVVDYKISIMTNYQQQMNELIQPLLTRTGAINYFIIEDGNHRFECFIQQEFTQDTKNEITEQERKYVTEIKIKVLGHLIGDGSNRENKVVEKIQNSVEIKIPKENLAFVQEEFRQPTNIIKGGAATLSSNIAVKKTFSIGNSTEQVYNINHNLNTKDMYVSVREDFDTFSTVQVSITFTDLNNISIDMGDVADPDNIGLKYVVTIIG